MNSLRKSPWISFYNSGGCNGCAIECLACFTPKYDLERFGCMLKDTARHADVIIVTGILTKQAAERFKRIFNQVPSPKKVVAIGACAVSGGVFNDSYSQAGPATKVVPVDVFVPGCPPKPEAIIQGVLKAIGRWKE